MRPRIFLLGLLAVACSAENTAPDAGLPGDGSAAPADAGIRTGADAGTEDGGRLPLVDVEHARELRAVWVATVSNIDFPSRTGLSPAAAQAELITILDTMSSLRLNAVVFQVRPEGDAFYPSTLEPWSRFLTGTQGGDPGWDPLAFLLTEAHARRIEVHAWLNPYRAKSNASSVAAEPHVSLRFPEHAHRYGNFLWMDPGATVVQDHVIAVIRDLVQRYAVDGVHFDDYFYPYPEANTPFPDDATWSTYQTGGGTLSREDWRRDNVNRLVQRISEVLAAEAPLVRFGISPFGIYRPGMPAGISGLDQYAAIFADPPKWIQEGWVDYLAPQLYWPTTQRAQAYEPLLQWWSALSGDGRSIFAGNFLSKLGDDANWSVDEIRAQVRISRQFRSAGSLGNIFFTIKPLIENRMGIADVFRDELYPTLALLPPLASQHELRVAVPRVSVDDRSVTLDHAERDSLSGYVLYRDAGAGFLVDRVVDLSSPPLELSAGRWAITALGLHGVESRGVLIEL